MFCCYCYHHHFFIASTNSAPATAVFATTWYYPPHLVLCQRVPQLPRRLRVALVIQHLVQRRREGLLADLLEGEVHTDVEAGGLLGVQELKTGVFKKIFTFKKTG